MKRWKTASLIAAVVAVVLLVLAGLVAVALPGLVKGRLVPKVEAATGRELTVGEISVNPFTWTVRVKDLRFSERGSKTVFAQFSSARISLSPASLFRMAPVVSAARISSPHLRISREGAGDYNFSDLRQWLPVHPRLIVHDLVVTRGSLDFSDRERGPGKPRQLRNIELTAPFITANPAYADRLLSLRLSALLDGSPLHLDGKFRPLRKTSEVSLKAELSDLCLPCYQAYLPANLAVRIESGKLSTRVNLDYRAAQLPNPGLALSGSVTLGNLKLAERTGAPFLAASRLEAQIASARPLQGSFELSALSADGLEAYLARDDKGVWSYHRLIVSAPPGAAPQHKLLVSVKEARLGKGRLHLTDQRPPGGFATDLKDITLDMHDYSTAPGTKASYALSLASGRGETARLKGEISPVPFTSSSQLDLGGVRLETYRPYFASLRRTGTQGTLDATGDLEYGGPGKFKLKNVSARSRAFSAQFAPWIGADHATLSLKGGSYSRELTGGKWTMSPSSRGKPGSPGARAELELLPRPGSAGKRLPPLQRPGRVRCRPPATGSPISRGRRCKPFLALQRSPDGRPSPSTSSTSR
jgi:hypothetical protein